MTWLLHCEIMNALEQSVFLSRTMGQPRITPEQAAIAQASLAEDLQQGSLFVQSEIPIAQLRARFQDLCFRHTAKHSFRTYDLLHVSSALVLGCDAFWSFDAKARKLARFEGLNLNG